MITCDCCGKDLEGNFYCPYCYGDLHQRKDEDGLITIHCFKCKDEIAGTDMLDSSDFESDYCEYMLTHPECTLSLYEYMVFVCENAEK
jgi:hypothetical protein